jgi:hypothetical protein
VAEEFLPLPFGGHAVFGAGAQISPAGDERPVPVNHFFGIDGLWRSQIFQPSECLSSCGCGRRFSGFGERVWAVAVVAKHVGSQPV